MHPKQRPAAPEAARAGEAVGGESKDVAVRLHRRVRGFECQLDTNKGEIVNVMAEDKIPDTQVPDTQEDFENNSQVNASALSDSLFGHQSNRKRTYDLYQDIDASQARKLDAIFAQHLANTVDTANMIGKQAVKHADVAADALWTDELNPVTRGAGNDLTGQAGVNAALASTASLNTVFNNLTAQLGEMVTAIVGLANSQAAQNLAIAQMIANAKQSPTPAPGA